MRWAAASVQKIRRRESVSMGVVAPSVVALSQGSQPKPRWVRHCRRCRACACDPGFELGAARDKAATLQCEVTRPLAHGTNLASLHAGGLAGTVTRLSRACIRE